ncbi:hypothetical protein V8C44DRAFT_370765 [Trichoderma aethiopicum]
MPHSTSRANDTQQPHASNGSSSHAHAISRFLVDPDQRRPLQFSTVLSVAEAEEADKARISAQLRAFQQRFASNSESTNGEQDN